MRRLGSVAATLLAVIAAVSYPAAQSDFSADRIKAHVTFLADDLLEGREAGTRGHEIAARYVASQFELLGLKPGGEHGSYFQTVPLIESALCGPKPTVTVATPKGKQTFAHRGKVIVRGQIAGGAVTVKAPMVFVGFGIVDATLGFDDYRGLNARGAFVVVLYGSPKGIDSEVAAHLRSQQMRVAAEHGALGIAWVDTRDNAKAFPWAVAVEQASEPLTSWVQKDGTPFDPLRGLKGVFGISPDAAPALFASGPQTLTQILDEADRGGRPAGFALEGTIELKVETKVRRFTSPEVIGVIEGSDPALKNDYVALMGHADHIGVKTEGTGDRINNGALDNAAGTATLIEVARALTLAPQRPRRSVLVVANTAEEKGLLGAEYFAHYPTVPIERITAAIDLDMPMLLYDFTDAVAYGASHSTIDVAFERAGAAMGVTMAPDPMPEQAIFVRSDHYSLAKVGVPAVMLATGMANGGEAAWAKFFAGNYHQPSDDLKQPILWSAGAKFAELNYRVVTELADADVPARWYAGDYFGTLFAPNAPKAPKAAP